MTYNHHPKVLKLMAQAAKRRDAMQALRDEGWTLGKIAAKYAVSKQRVFQILHPEASK